MSRSRCGGRVVRHVVDGDLGVQQIARKDGRHSRTIVWPEGTLHVGASRFLCLHDGSGTQRTYTYLLVDHLQWLERECRAFDVGNCGTANASTRPSPASAARRPGQRRRRRPPRRRLPHCPLRQPQGSRTAVTTAMAEVGERRCQMLADQNDQSKAIWRERALNAEDALKATQPRSSPSGPESVNSLARSMTSKPSGSRRTSNGSPPRARLKRQVRQLGTDNRTLDEQLGAALPNLRFQDRPCRRPLSPHHRPSTRDLKSRGAREQVRSLGKLPMTADRPAL